MISKLADIAKSQVGKREEGNNSGPAVRKYQSATNLDPGEWPWCSAFVCWCLREWLALPGAREWLSLHGTTEDWRPQTAAAFGMLEWSRNRPLTTKILPATEKPQAGDLVVFRFSHIGIVTGTDGDSILTTEGNTNGAGEREGDGVWSKHRQAKLVRAFIRIHPRKD